MPSINQILTEQFYRWERRGRGWQVFDEPVCPEPPFLSFRGHGLPDTPTADDGRRPTAISSFVQRLSRVLSTAPAPSAIMPEVEEEPEPQLLIRDKLIELQTSPPANLNIAREQFEQLLLNVSLCREPIAFELLGLPQKVIAQFAAHSDDASLLHRQMRAYFPEATFRVVEDTLEQAWDGCEGDDVLVVEFGLEREFMLPLASGKLDPFIGIISALAELQTDELALFQVLFQPVQHPWSESVLRSVTNADGRPFFINAPELGDAAKAKVGRPLYAAVVRILLRTGRHERTLQIARDLAGSLRVFANPNGNALIPLSNDEYPFEEHVDDALLRQSRRSGMLLNSEELTGFVHLPSSAVRSPALQRETGKTKAAPNIALSPSGVLLGHNQHNGRSTPVYLSAEQRTRHLHLIGASGTGKSTLLFNIIRHDIENGAGVAVLDPHGDLVERILGVIPPSRIDDVVLVDPSDEEYSVGFNILHAHSNLERTLLASDLVSVFRRLSTSWGDQMDAVLKNAILAFLTSSRPGTLADLRRFLVEPGFRADYIASVSDPEIVYYWQKGFPLLAGNKSVGPILTRLNDFLATPTIRCMVSQLANRLDFAGIMDAGRIFLAKLPAGLVGEKDCHLLGALLISKFQQVAMSRQAQKTEARRDFWIFADEFDNFISPSMAEILKGTRKYRVGLTLAHHELQQLQRNPDVASAVLSNCYTRVVFRVGDEDARKLSDGFASFEARDLQNLGIGQAIARVERSDFDFNLSIPLAEESDAVAAAEVRNRAISASRRKYARPRAEVEAELLRQFRTMETDKSSEASRAKAKAREAKVEPKKEEASAIPSPEIVKPSPSVPLTTPPTDAVESSIPEAKPAEAPNETGPEKIEVPAVVTAHAPDTVREPPPPREPGRGGAQHKAIQGRIKKTADELGFKSTPEAEVLNGRGKIDVLLERTDHTIACEIALTPPIDREVGNVVKCIKAGLSNIAVICLDERHQEKIKTAVTGSLGADVAKAVSYYHPDQFIAYLKALPPPLLATDGSKVRRGFKVKRTRPNLSADELLKREEAAIRIIAEEMLRKTK